jgi:hypothetical protein
MRGNIVTFSAKVRSGANWSPTGGAVTLELDSGTGSPAKLSAGFTGQVTVASASVNLGTSSAVTTITATGIAAFPTNANQAQASVTWTPVGPAGAADYVEVDEITLTITPVATAFERRRFDEELASCQRFYWKSFAYGTAPTQGTAGGQSILLPQVVGASTLQTVPLAAFPVKMRGGPFITFFNPSAANAQVRNASISADCSGAVVQNNNGDGTVGIAFITAPGSAAGQSNSVHITAEAEV